MVANSSFSPARLRRCAVNGCPWRGPCPDHDHTQETDVDLNRIMRQRPFGAGRKQRHSTARYSQRSVVKSAVVLTTIADREKEPPKQIRRRRLFRPNPLHPEYGHPTARGESAATATVDAEEFSGANTNEPVARVAEHRDASPPRFRQRRGIRKNHTQPRHAGSSATSTVEPERNREEDRRVIVDPASAEPGPAKQVIPPSPALLAQLLRRRPKPTGRS